MKGNLFLILLVAATSFLVTKVYDGDTITVEFDGKVEKVRLIGIDAPKLDGTYGPAAQRCLEKLVGGKAVTLIPGVQERDRYGRLLAYVYIDDLFVNLEMVRCGCATVWTVPPNVDHADEFCCAQKEARAEKRGLWADL